VNFSIQKGISEDIFKYLKILLLFIGVICFMFSMGKFKQMLIAVKDSVDCQAEAALYTAKANGSKFANDHGVMEARYIIGLIIGIYLLAALIPAAISALNGANVTGWTTTQTAIWAVLSIIILATVIMKISE
jgi:hypothetical protein